MTQRRDSVFQNIVNNEPVAETTQSDVRDNHRMERLRLIALMLMSEVTDGLLDNEGSEHGFT